jgi:hypothetical protein
MPKRRIGNQPADPWKEPDPPLALAVQQMEWYSAHRGMARRAYWASEVLLLLAAAATTLAAALQARPWITASLAASSLVLTGLRKVFDWHEEWLAFTGAWMELRSAIYDYRLLPEGQRDDHARRELMDTVNSVAASETGRWSDRRRSLADGASK